MDEILIGAGVKFFAKTLVDNAKKEGLHMPGSRIHRKRRRKGPSQQSKDDKGYKLAPHHGKSSSLIFTLETPQQKSFIKATPFTERGPELLKQVTDAHEAAMYSDRPTRTFTMVAYRQTPGSGDNRVTEELLPIPIIQKGDVLIENQGLDPNGVPFEKTLLEKKGRKLDAVIRRQLTQIALVANKLHSTPFPDFTGAEISNLYSDCLNGMLAKVLVYIPADENHPILSTDEIDEFHRLGRQKVKLFAEKTELLVRAHGDIRPRNIHTLSDNSVILVDFLRPWSLRGIEIGRFLLDFKEFYLVTQNPFYLKAANYFLSQYEEVSGDENIRESVILGLYSRLPAKIGRKSSTIKDNKIERTLYNETIEIINEGRYR